MEAWIQSLLESTTAPMLVALLLGLLTAISPCPLATNIAAVSYIGKDVADRRRVFAKGLMYTLGRTVSYTVLGGGAYTDSASGTECISLAEIFLRDW